MSFLVYKKVQWRSAPPPVNFDRFDPKPGESRPQAKTVTVEVREEQADSQKSVGSPLTRLAINTYVQYLG